MNRKHVQGPPGHVRIWLCHQGVYILHESLILELVFCRNIHSAFHLERRKRDAR